MKNSDLNKTIGLLVVGVLLTILGFYFISYMEGRKLVVTQGFVIVSMLIVIFVAVLLSLQLTRKLLYIAQQDQLVETQRLHIEHLQEMNRVIRTQRHDFVNHLQTVYGLLRLGEVEQAEVHITELYHDVQVSGEILRLAIPEATALLMVKMGLAISLNISFTIQVESDLSGLKIRPLDIVTILGNLVNNALEAVENLEPDLKKVKLSIFENSAYVFLQTHNPGFIPEEIQARVFDPGFSTKSATDRGLGLSSVKQLVERHKGRIELNSDPEQGTSFKVSIPR